MKKDCKKLRKPLVSCTPGCKDGWTIEPGDTSIEVTYDEASCKIIIKSKALYETPKPCCSGGTGGTSVPGPQGPPGPPGTSIVGPQGNTGITGAPGGTGPQGATGAPGADGTNGVDGQDAILGKVKYVRPFLVQCSVVPSSTTSSPAKLAQAWVEEAGSVFFVRSWAEAGVALTGVATSYPTLIAAEAAADAMAGSWNCP